MTLRFGTDVCTATTDYGTVLLDQRTGQYWELNPTATLVVSTLMAGGDADDATNALVREFDVTPAQARDDVTALIGELRAGGLAA
ncbi:lasso peptide biosynthesis PqqD family chaperone [Streptomyces sp. NPDC096205]|uniref:lasso peptide biosynthesis PqqD family chaperone n=1 Tax=Streptomyces sp. NPDC096205 TaxID=3366081 RepID=UPI003815351B